MKHKTNEAGVTLVELLAAIVITTIIGFVIYGVLFGGFKTYDRVKIETKLRDEADLIMAELISDMFTLHTSDIEHLHLPEQGSDHYIQLKDGKKIGFINHDVLLQKGPTSALQTGDIRLSSKSKISAIGENQFHIYLTLEHTSSEQTLSTESEIGIIDNGS